MWLEPYNNGKIKDEVISYIVPIYQGNMLIGVAGMDILFSSIENPVAKINAYDTGYACLITEDNSIIYHPQEIEELPMAKMNKWNEFRLQARNTVEGCAIFEYQQDGERYKVAC